MDPIPQWSFRNDQGVSEHLKTCPFNVRNSHEEVGPKERAIYKQALKAMRDKFEMKKKLQSMDRGGLWIHCTEDEIKPLLYMNTYNVLKMLLKILCCDFVKDQPIGNC